MCACQRHEAPLPHPGDGMTSSSPRGLDVDGCARQHTRTHAQALSSPSSFSGRTFAPKQITARRSFFHSGTTRYTFVGSFCWRMREFDHIHPHCACRVVTGQVEALLRTLLQKDVLYVTVSQACVSPRFCCVLLPRAPFDFCAWVKTI